MLLCFTHVPSPSDIFPIRYNIQMFHWESRPVTLKSELGSDAQVVERESRGKVEARKPVNERQERMYHIETLLGIPWEIRGSLFFGGMKLLLNSDEMKPEMRQRDKRDVPCSMIWDERMSHLREEQRPPLNSGNNERKNLSSSLSIYESFSPHQEARHSKARLIGGGRRIYISCLPSNNTLSSPHLSVWVGPCT